MEDFHKTDFGKRFDVFRNSEEMKIYQNLLALKASFKVFSGNFYEITQELESLKDPRAFLDAHSKNHEEDISELLDQVLRLLHNFLASAFSLIEHTRKIVKKLYSGKEFQQEYQKKLQEDVISHPIHCFVKHLRNYAQHYTLPILDLRTSLIGTGNFENLNFSVRMDVEVLKQWDGWKTSRSYLDALNSDWCVDTIVTEYFTLIQDFYNWLSQRQTVLHQADMNKLKQMQDDLNRAT